METDVRSIPINLKIVTEIMNDKKQRDTISFNACGELVQKQGVSHLKFTEIMEEINEVKTLLRIKDNQILLFRTGAVSMRLLFEKGRETTGEYSSQLGRMDIQAKTEVMNYKFNEKSKKGNLLLTYYFSMQGEQIGRYKMTITFKVKEETL